MIRLCSKRAALYRLDPDDLLTDAARAVLENCPEGDVFYRAYAGEGGVALLRGGRLDYAGAVPSEGWLSLFATLAPFEIRTPYRFDLPFYEAQDKLLILFPAHLAGGGEPCSDIAALYRLLSECFPLPAKSDFTEALTEQRLYLGGKAVAVSLAGEPAAAAVRLSRSKKADLIGAVCSHPKHRGEGLAGAALGTLVNEALDAGRIPYLYCAPALGSYYEKYGGVIAAETRIYRHV